MTIKAYIKQWGWVSDSLSKKLIFNLFNGSKVSKNYPKTWLRFLTGFIALSTKTISRPSKDQLIGNDLSTSRKHLLHALSNTKCNIQWWCVSKSCIDTNLLGNKLLLLMYVWEWATPYI